MVPGDFCEPGARKPEEVEVTWQIRVARQFRVQKSAAFPNAGQGVGNWAGNARSVFVPVRSRRMTQRRRPSQQTGMMFRSHFTNSLHVRSG
jgi:hypothetical protein